MTVARPALWLWYSSVPGMAAPGMACPGMAGTGAYPFWVYIGLVPGVYWDYIDTTTMELLYVYPRLWYTMKAVSNRAGLSVPPPDDGWPEDRWSPRTELAEAVPSGGRWAATRRRRHR